MPSAPLRPCAQPMMGIQREHPCVRCGSDDWIPHGKRFRCRPCRTAQRARYDRANGEAHRKRHAEWRKANPDKMKAAARRQYHANPKKKRANKLKWQLANAEQVRLANKRYREANKERAKPIQRAWRQANPERGRLNSHLRRAKVHAAFVGDKESLASYIKWARRALSVCCYWCGHPTKRESRHVDHITPIAKGGAHSVANLCVACPSCNMAKGSKLPEQYAVQAELRLA